MAQHIRHFGEHAGLIDGGYLQVVRAHQAADAQRRQPRPGGSRHGKIAARQSHQVRHHRRRRLHAAGARADVHGRAHGVSARQHRVHHAGHLGKQLVLRHQRQVDAGVHAVRAPAGDGQVLDGEAEFAGIAHVLDVHAGDALHMYAAEVDVRVEGRRRQHRQLLRGVQAFHVEGGIGFRVAEALGFGKGGGEILPVVLHRREDVVGGAVDDARE